MALNLNNVQLRMSAGFASQFPRDAIAQVAFSGRSNVGKSSLINSLLGRKSLARVSGTPGKTITINFYEIDKKMFFVDLPGYGFAKRKPDDKKVWSELTDGYFTKNPNLQQLKLVVQLVDSRIGPTEDDCMMMDYLAKSNVPFVVVATKSDKLNKTEFNQSEEMLLSHPSIPEGTPILLYSSLKNDGRKELWQLISTFTNIRV